VRRFTSELESCFAMGACDLSLSQSPGEQVETCNPGAISVHAHAALLPRMRFKSSLARSVAKDRLVVENLVFLVVKRLYAPAASCADGSTLVGPGTALP